MFIPARDTGDADIEPIPRYAPRQRTKPNGKRDDIGHRGKALRRSGAFLRYRAAAKDHAVKGTRPPISTAERVGSLNIFRSSFERYRIGFSARAAPSPPRAPSHSAAENNVRKGA